MAKPTSVTATWPVSSCGTPSALKGQPECKEGKNQIAADGGARPKAVVMSDAALPRSIGRASCAARREAASLWHHISIATKCLDQCRATIVEEVTIMRNVIGLAFVFGLLPTMANAAGPLGLWSAGEGRIHVKIDHCGEVLCGKIVWVSEAEAREASSKGLPSIIGVQLLSELRPSSNRSGQWEGKVYNLQDGRTYSVYLRPGTKQMEVEGCLLIFCRTQIWPRVESEGIRDKGYDRALASTSTVIRQSGSPKPWTASPVEAGPGRS
jgi:uncharacterized protein (DUF2147 family)